MKEINYIKKDLLKSLILSIASILAIIVIYYFQLGYFNRLIY